MEKSPEIPETKPETKPKPDEYDSFSLTTTTIKGSARDLRLLQRQRAKEMEEEQMETVPKTQDTDLTGNHFDLAKFRAKK